MTHDLISLTIIMAVAVICPVIAERIPGKPIPQTVLLLAFGAILGPHVLNRIWLTDATDLLSELGLAFLFRSRYLEPKHLGGSSGTRACCSGDRESPPGIVEPASRPAGRVGTIICTDGGGS